jgi:hypothetical protein
VSPQLAVPSHADQIVPAPRGRTRTALAVAGVAAVIAAGGVAAGQILLPGQSGPAQESQYVPSEQAQRSLSDTVGAEYRTGLATRPRRVGTQAGRVSQARREAIAHQYRSR